MKCALFYSTFYLKWAFNLQDFLIPKQKETVLLLSHFAIFGQTLSRILQRGVLAAVVGMAVASLRSKPARRGAAARRVFFGASDAIVLCQMTGTTTAGMCRRRLSARRAHFRRTRPAQTRDHCATATAPPPQQRRDCNEDGSRYIKRSTNN